MIIEDKKVVSLIYELNVDGEIADKTTPEHPLDFIQGTGSLPPLFEKNIAGKQPGDKFSFTIQPEDGYGKWTFENVIDLPKEAFAVDGKIREDLLVPGTLVPLMNQMGGVVPGKVLEVREKTVGIDLNHPMAGKILNFSGEILNVREATEKELTEGLHGELVQHHECSCGCGHEDCNCEGDCSGECHHGEGGCHHGEGDGECHHGEGKCKHKKE